MDKKLNNMSKPQITTMGGLGVLAASVQKVASLFGDYKIEQICDALNNIGISNLIVAVAGFIVSIVAIYYNEDKGVVAPNFSSPKI